MLQEKEKKRQVSCSFCNKSGHTKKNCPEFLRIRKEKKNAVLGDSRERQIRVNTTIVPQSRFVVDLGRENSKEAEAMPVYLGPSRIDKPRHYSFAQDDAILAVSIRPDLKMLQTGDQFNVVKNSRFHKISINTETKTKSHEVTEKTSINRGFVPELPHAERRAGFKSDCTVADTSCRNSGLGNFWKNISLTSPRFALVIVGLLLLIALPYPAYGYLRSLGNMGDRVVAASTNAFSLLQSSTVAAFSANIPQAQHDLNGALSSFYDATTIMDKEHHVAQFVAGLLPVIGEKIASRGHLLTAGHHLALGNTYLIKGVSETEGRTELSLTDRVEILRIHLQSSIPEYDKALSNLSLVSQSSLPVEYQETFGDFKILFSAFINDMRDLLELSRAINLVFGSEQFQRYLIMFQNEHELRPTGGFWGSFAIMDVQKGKILKFDIPGGGTYDLQGQYSVSVKPPLPLQVINKRWELQDANWFPDFAASAAKADWFYRHGRGASVDGVIAVNSSVLERLLRIIGPVMANDFGLAVSAEDAIYKIQKHVEIDYDKNTNKPKAVLGDLTNDLAKKMLNLNAASAIKLLGELNEALTEKEIQIYSKNPDVQKKMAEFGWTGEIYETSPDEDYLYVVTANIFGGKTNAVTDQYIDHEIQVNEMGEVYGTVKITRNHNGVAGQTFYGHKNTEYIRIYVPLGSELIDAGGFKYPDESAFSVPESWYEVDIDLNNYEREKSIHSQTGTRVTEEFGKTVFGNWSIVDPGDSTEVFFRYKLPFKVAVESREETNLTRMRDVVLGRAKEVSSYRVVYQKQSGITPTLKTTLVYPEKWREVWDSEDDETVVGGKNTINFTGSLKTDKVIGVLMAKD